MAERTGHVWQDIRALRAAPTGLAVNDKGRRALLSAALGQAEELATAAKAVSYAASPLPLFYSLSQAGRAIAAAHQQGRYEITGHGLHFDVASKLPGRDSTMLQRTLHSTVAGPSPRPEKTCRHCGEITAAAGNPAKQAFQVVAEAVGSPRLSGETTLGALWAANPDLMHLPVPAEFGEWLPALDHIMGSNLMGGHPPKPSPEEMPTSNGGRVRAALCLPETTAAELTKILDRYPTLRGAYPLKPGEVRPASDELVPYTTNKLATLRILVAKDAPNHIPLSEDWNWQAALFSVVEAQQGHQQQPHTVYVGYALPEIGGGPSPSPLMLWWALLYGLSNLARYYPAAWAEAINVDGSTLAVPLQRVLNVAAEQVPVRVLAALRG